ncbi:MAG: hypothetical protein RLZZ546_75 [Bacteroidota bacterium]|jgi:glycosyltransferase involved in cell wall biosynthesis
MILNDKKNLSVIIPCYKIDKNNYLNELLYSIVNQEENNFNVLEIILVNDSPDIDLIPFIQPNLLSKIIIINNETNKGQAFSRNKGACIAQGEFLHFIDQDDLIALNFYKNIQNSYDIMIGNCFLFNENKQIRLYKSHRIKIYSFFKNTSSLNFFLIFDNIILSPGQAIFKKEIFNNLNGFPVLENFGSDDYGLMFKYASNKIEYRFFSNALFYHRLHRVQGKRYLNMNLSKKDFFVQINAKTIFTKICSNNSKIIQFFKKITYVLFNNRIS